MDGCEYILLFSGGNASQMIHAANMPSPSNEIQQIVIIAYAEPRPVE